MAMYNIDCMSYNEFDDAIERDWEINIDGKVWPCCHYLVESYAHPTDNTLMSDKALTKAFEQDPNWNNLNYYDLYDIVNHDYYQNHCCEKAWNSDNPPPLCIKMCHSGRQVRNIE